MPDAGQGLVAERVRLLDGRDLRTVVAGSGDPLVVFESGAGLCAPVWAAVQRLVARRTRTLAYDRAGYVGSDPDPRRRTLEAIVADLAALLDLVSPRAPVVLVGASFGVEILRGLAAAHPARVAGLVFSDPATSASRQADPTMDELRRLEAAGLPDVPVTTLVGGRPGRYDAGRRQELLDSTRREMAAHPRGRFVTATGSNHFIPWQEPELLAEEILRTAADAAR